MSERRILVGESNPYGVDPRFALYPRPLGASGDRLCRFVMGLDEDAYLERFERRNLCAGKWSIRDVRITAAVLRGGSDRKVLVLLGRKVASAFDVHADPFTVLNWSKDIKAVVLPHPSGLCRVWHEPRAVERARAALALGGAL